MKLPFVKKPVSLKFKLPKPRVPLLRRRTRLSRIWSRFLRQIPPTYRHFIQSYPSHFIVIGDENSGKSQLIQKFIDQDRDVYSFETSYTANSDVQFYLGQRYILQEVAWSLIEDRSIWAKKQLAGLWRRLYSYREPIFVVTFDPIRWENADPEKINHYARLLLNKIILLSHVIDKPIKVRIALTHVDKIEGYAEFLRVLRLHGITIDFPLSSYDNDTLKEVFKSFEEYLPLVLKNSSGEDYLKVLSFFKRLSDLTNCIDHFIRSLTQKEYEKQVLLLDKASFVSHQESDTGSEIFDCKQELAPSVYIKRHYYKHQVACACIAVIGCATLGGFMYSRKHELGATRNKIALLERYQTQEALNEVLPHLASLKKFATNKQYLNRLQPIYSSSFDKQIDNFVEYSRDYILLPTFRKIVLNTQSEIEMVYFLSLVKATQDNRLGELISENTAEWSAMLDLPEEFVSAYVKFAKEPQPTKHYLEEFTSLCAVTPLSDPKPWFQFFEQVQHVMSTPSAMEAFLPDLKVHAEKLENSLKKLQHHTLTPFLCKILLEDKELASHSGFLPKIRLLQDLRNNVETLNGLLEMVCDTSLEAPTYSQLNLKSFLTTLDDFLTVEDKINTSYHFILAGKRWKFETAEWTDIVVKAKVKAIVDNYIVSNRDKDIQIFFKNSPDLLHINLSYLGEVFPQFRENCLIPACFTVSAYERNIYPISETLAKLNQSKFIPSEVKNELSQYIAQSVESYARQYKEEYEKLLKLFNVRPVNFEEAKMIIGYMTEPLSHFTQFLHTVRNNLSIPHSDSLVLFPMSHLSEFRFFQNLLPEELDKPGAMHHYQTFLRSMLKQVKFDGPSVMAENHGILENYLTPLSRVSLAILTNHSASFQSQLEEWFEETQIPVKYQSFFLNPVTWIHELGLQELAQSIEQAWKTECAPVIDELFAKFPFNQESTEYATCEEVKNILQPTCPFWDKIHQILGAVSLIEDTKWKSRFAKQFNLSSTIYDSVNLASHASCVLWDNNGDPQPIRFKVRTVPFVLKDEIDKQPVLSYLITGGQSLFNVNQQPHSETLEFKWWDPDEILMGFELFDSDSNVTSYKDMKIEVGEWNFYQLFTKSDQKDEHNWSWIIPEEEDHEFSLYFEESPWQILNPNA